ncbi:MAG: SUMF1/EgtB/PvdO family nonheme iron enzyme [Xenococcaceae cyanobacterium]
MTKIALLIGVSQYQSDLTDLPKATKDVLGMQEVLQNPDTAGFEQVKPLLDPDAQTMREEVEVIFSGCHKDDLVLLFFSGHGIKDDRGKLYFATNNTRKKDNGKLIWSTAVAAGFIQDLMSQSRCKHQVVILDCCFSGAFATGMTAKDIGDVDIQTQLGGEGRAVLTSSTSTQYSFEQEESDLSIYSRYIVEGIATGAADLDSDGWIEVQELHEYAKGKVQATAPAMKPEIYAVKEGFKIKLAKAVITDPKLKYRKEVERYASRGDIPNYRRIILNTLREKLGLSSEEAAVIEDEVLRPYRERQKHLQRYREAFHAAIDYEFPLGEATADDLKNFQRMLGLRDEDIQPIWEEVTTQFRQQAGTQQPIVDRKIRENKQRTKSQTPPPAPPVTSSPLVGEIERGGEESIARGRENEEIRAEENIFSSHTTPTYELRENQSPAQPRRERSSSESTSSAPRRNNTNTTGITRKKFLQWAGWGGGGLVATLVGSQILNQEPELTDKSTPEPIKINTPESTPEPISTPESTDKPAAISVAEPKYIEPTEDGEKFAGLPLWAVEFETVTVNTRGEEASRSTHQADFFKEDLDNGVILEMVSIPAGEFIMGSPSDEKDRDEDESPQHKVSVPAFFMGKFAVTQAQYQAVMGSNSSYFQGDNRPVKQVSWNDANEFCQKLSEKTGRNYRLPSEAEWEYACRAGTITPFHFGATLTSNLANYNANYTYQSEPEGEYRQETTEVGIFPPNAFGLYDMHGNVWEWCEDDWHDNYNGAPSDGSVWRSRSNIKVVWGGSWHEYPRNCRSANRYRLNPAPRYNDIGLRVVCSSA